MNAITPQQGSPTADLSLEWPLMAHNDIPNLCFKESGFGYQ